jgi:hypothetical protein
MARILTTFAVVDGIEVRVRSGTMGGSDWCAIGQLGFATDGTRVRLVNLLEFVKSTAVPVAVPASLRLGPGAPIDGAEAFAVVARLRSAILALRDEGVSVSEIARRVGIPRERARGILRRHDGTGRVSRCGPGRRSRVREPRGDAGRGASTSGASST